MTWAWFGAATRLLLVMATLGLAACATQTRDQAAIGIGTAAYAPQAAKPFAILYKPYAQMAAVAYTDADYQTGACPDAAKLRASGKVENKGLASIDDALHRADWSCLLGHVGPYGCKLGTPRCLNGLEYHVWRRMQRGKCEEAVIAFRGSDANEIGDWLSNFRWFVGGRYFDQYDQVQKAVPGIIGAMYRRGCRPKMIVATGHSLGGGLAQHAAYADKRIGYVYAFDPSPVTAFFGVPLPVRNAATEDLGIDRIYEAGEVLSLPRYIASGVFPSSQCHPRVRIVRFNTVTAPSLVERHRIRNLAAGLVALSAGSKRSDKGQLGFAHARNCDYVQPDKFGE